MSVALIGLGNQALGDHIPALLRRDDLTIIGAMDPDPTSINNFRSQFPSLSNIKLTATIIDLLDHISPDMAIVAVPHQHYYGIAQQLCERSIPFLKEKPYARTVAEAELLQGLAGFERLAFITSQRRFNKLFHFAKESIDTIGRPYLFHSIYKLNIAAPHTGWRGSRQMAGGGCLIDMGYHIVDQLVWWFGIPEKINATISTLAVDSADYDAEDSATIAFQYKNGLHGSLVISRSAGEKKEEYELYADRGYIEGSKKEVRVFDKAGRLTTARQETNKEAMIDNQLAFFVDRVRKGEGFKDVQARHMANMRFIDACYEDALTVNPITKPTYSLNTLTIKGVA